MNILIKTQLYQSIRFNSAGLFFFIFFSTVQAIDAQTNFFGKPGYMTIPTAGWNDDKELGFSFGFIPKEYSQDIFIVGNPEKVNVYSVRVTLTSFMEVNFGVFYRPNLSDSIGVGDRQLDFRFRILKESEFFPSIVLGWSPPGSRAPLMSHDHLVATKNFITVAGKFQVSLGYGSPYVLYRNAGEDNEFWKSLHFIKKEDFYNNHYLTGIYGGVSYEPFSFIGASVEYNTSTINAGIYGKFWDEHIILQAYAYEGKELAINLSLQFSLNFLPRSLRRYEN